MPVVAGTDDGVLNDITALHVTPHPAEPALAALSGGPMPPLAGPLLSPTGVNHEGHDPHDLAAVEAVAEAVITALVAGRDTAAIKPKGRVVRSIDHDHLRRIFQVFA